MGSGSLSGCLSLESSSGSSSFQLSRIWCSVEVSSSGPCTFHNSQNLCNPTYYIHVCVHSTFTCMYILFAYQCTYVCMYALMYSACVIVSPFPVVMGIGMAGALVFIFLQVLLIVDFAHSWNGSWYVSVYHVLRLVYKL